jgi:hypothetical protein
LYLIIYLNDSALRWINKAESTAPADATV